MICFNAGFPLDRFKASAGTTRNYFEDERD